MTAEAITPTVRATTRRWAFWVVGGVVVLIIALGVFSLGGATAGGRPYDPENPAPEGTKALIEVLRDRGVQVVVTDSLARTRTATGVPTPTTLVILDDGGYLDDDQLTEAAALAETVVVLDPGFSDLLAIAPEVAQAGWVTGVADADCDVPAVQAAGRVTVDGEGYRVIDASAGTTTCLGTGDDVVSLVGLDRGDTRLWVLGAIDALTNARIVEEGNAAFALGMLGEHERLVWYMPSFDDLPPGGSIPELSPTWVVPVMVLLAVVAFLAALWRGRRLGPLIVENLPVTVRAAETMQGRARLYERSNARLRALDALRIGTIQRIAVLCGLPTVATVDEVIGAAAALTGAQPADLRRLLVDVDPPTDRDLVAYSDALLDLERDIAARVRS